VGEEGGRRGERGGKERGGREGVGSDVEKWKGGRGGGEGGV